MKIGDVVRWAGRGQDSPNIDMRCFGQWKRPNIGIVESYCSFQNLWLVRFPDGRFEIEAFLLEMISESG